MPASNRRPLYDGADAPQASDISTTPTLQRDPAPALASSPTPAAAAFAAQQASFKQPCTLKGAASAVYAGALGYFIGFVPATIKFKARQWGMIHTQGLASAQQLAIMSGMYTAVHCICQRIRMVEDGWNRGIAGCSTGLVLGWSNGPWSALQSCAGLGLISALIDLGGGVEAAEARTLQPLQHAQHHTPLSHSTECQQQSSVQSWHHHSQQRQRMRPKEGQAQGGGETQQQGAGGAQALAGLPQPAQLLALLMGASPHSISNAAADMPSMGDQQAPSTGAQQLGTKQRQQEHQVQQQEDKRSKKQQVQQRRIDMFEPSNSPAQMQQQQQQALQYQLQQPLAMAALLMQPAVRTAQQLMSAPPLTFLGACCNSNAASSAASVHSFAAAADADIDGCPLEVTPAASVTAGNRRK